MTSQPRIVSMDDVTGDRRHGAEIRALLGPMSVGATSGFMGVSILKPGEVIREHYHPYSEEFIFLIEGRLTARVDGENREVVAHQGMMIPMNMRHRFMNESDEDAFMLFHLSPLAPRPDLGHISTEPAPTEAG